MPAYCTQADLELAIRPAELVQLTVDDNADTVDTTILDRAIARASSRIDAVAGAHYVVPFASTPDFIRDLATDLTLVELASRRQVAPKWAEARRVRVEADLQALAAGTLTVGEQPEPPRNAERLPRQSAADPVFTDDALRGF